MRGRDSLGESWVRDPRSAGNRRCGKENGSVSIGSGVRIPVGTTSLVVGWSLGVVWWEQTSMEEKEVAFEWMTASALSFFR
jgi:hypothetical protein